MVIPGVPPFIAGKILIIIPPSLVNLTNSAFHLPAVLLLQQLHALHPLDEGWTPNHDRVRWAVQRINQYLQNEKDVLAEAEEIKTFCDNNM